MAKATTQPAKSRKEQFAGGHKDLGLVKETDAVSRKVNRVMRGIARKRAARKREKESAARRKDVTARLAGVERRIVESDKAFPALDAKLGKIDRLKRVHQLRRGTSETFKEIAAAGRVNTPEAIQRKSNKKRGRK